MLIWRNLKFSTSPDAYVNPTKFTCPQSTNVHKIINILKPDYTTTDAIIASPNLCDFYLAENCLPKDCNHPLQPRVQQDQGNPSYTTS